ncbi:MAG: hypothetical protein ABH817_01250 [archaeon]
MKKLILLSFIFVLVGFLAITCALSEGNQGENQGNSLGNNETGNQTQTKAGNLEQLHLMIQNRNQEMEQERLNFNNQNKEKVFQNQNKVREAVHAFLSMEDLVGVIGPRVSVIAREFNNSVNKTAKAEERIYKKSGFAKFFTGGEEVAVEELEEELDENQNRIQELQQLMGNCECSEELRNLFQEQIQNMEQEQTRLRELAQKEKRNKGMFGWLWK